MNDEIIFFAKTNFRNKEQIFGIKQDDRRRHMYVIGKTGMGKTNLIQNMAIQDIRNGKGVAIVDPHGEFAEECLKAVPANRINDVIYFNPADTANPIAMNVMEKVDPEYRHLIASGLVGVFKKIWADSWGPRLEYLLRNAILALLEYPTSTLLGVTKILVDKEYRTKVMEKVSDPVIKSFWTEEFTKYHDRLMADAIAPIQNKVGQFLSSSLIRNIVGQVKSSFDIRYVMDNQKILIMNLSKGRIGEDNSALLGAMMITKIQLAAMARVDMPESRRKDFYLYVDEFQNFATESFANILSEARKYRLNLILAHQYITQLDERVQNAVFGNVGTLITFRVGASDAEFLEKEFSPVFYMTDLVNLAKYNIYLKLMIDGVATSPFSANTLPPIDTSDTGVNYEKIIRVSAERYGTPRKIVEDKINRWSGVTSVEVKDKLEEIIKEERKAKSKKTPDSFSDISKTRKAAKNEIERSLPSRIKEQKEMNKGGGVILEHKREINKRQPVLPKNEYETECSVCSAKIKVPFKPDGQRPVFCKECLKEYRRAQMKLQNEIKSSERKQNFLTPKDKKAIESKKKNNRGELKALIEKAMSQREKE
jgi:CxxC-x17-CxxC domain-containing protein